MGTTALIVELLVVGVLATVWIALLGLAFFGRTYLPESLGALSVFILPYLSFAYCVGIIINRFCDFIFKPWEQKISIPIWAKCDREYVYVRLLVFHTSEGLTSYLDRLWALVRIFRSTMLNSLMLILAFLVFMWLRLGWSIIDRILISVVAVLLEGALLKLLFESWKKVTTHYHTNLFHAYEIVSKEKFKAQVEKRGKK